MIFLLLKKYHNLEFQKSILLEKCSTKIKKFGNILLYYKLMEIHQITDNVNMLHGTLITCLLLLLLLLKKKKVKIYLYIIN